MPGEYRGQGSGQMDMDIWNRIEYFIGLAVLGVTSFFFKSQVNRIRELEKEVKESKEDIIVLQVEMKNISGDIAEIKLGINRLVDKLLSKDE